MKLIMSKKKKEIADYHSKLTFEVNGVKFMLTGTRRKGVEWFHDVKNLETGKHGIDIPHENIKKYLKQINPEI